MAWKIKKITYANAWGNGRPEIIQLLRETYKDKRMALEDAYMLNKRAILDPHTHRYEVVEV
jgi:hypothetical protein